MSDNSICPDPNATALLVVDVQQALFERPTPIYRADELLNTLSNLIEHVDQRWRPWSTSATATNCCNPDRRGGSCIRRLQPADDDLVIYKTHGNAFQDTSLDAELNARAQSRTWSSPALSPTAVYGPPASAGTNSGLCCDPCG